MTGTVCVIQKETKLEWKIDDFLRLEKYVYSPEFSFSDASWTILINPFQRYTNLIPADTTEYIGLFLYSRLVPKPLTVNMTLSFKTVDGKSDLEDTFTCFIDKMLLGFLRPNMISRSKLIERKSELLPSGALTVICTLKQGEPSVVNERQFLDASVQTGEITEHKLLDATAQTGEITEHKLLDASSQTSEITGIWKLQKHLHEISISGDISDVILKVKDQEFRSHRCILAARSPVFSAMMKNKMKENVTGVVDISDIDPETFSNFLNYLYTGRTEDLTPENVAKLYKAADKYQVQVLKENCLDYMLENVSVENFCDIFTISVQHNEETLKETCIEYFGKHLLDIIETCKWQSFLCENPIICNELHIKLLKLKYLIPQTSNEK